MSIVPAADQAAMKVSSEPIKFTEEKNKRNCQKLHGWEEERFIFADN